MNVQELAEIEKGELLVKVLGLKNIEQLPAKRYMLGEGYHTKTALGVYKVCKRIVEEGTLAVVLAVSLSGVSFGTECPMPYKQGHIMEMTERDKAEYFACRKADHDRVLDSMARLDAFRAQNRQYLEQAEEHNRKQYADPPAQDRPYGEPDGPRTGPGSQPMGGHQGYSNGNTANPTQYGFDAYYGYAGGKR